MAFDVALVPHLRDLHWEFHNQLPAHAPAQQAQAPLEGLGQIIKATQPGSLTPETLSSFDLPVPPSTPFLLPLPFSEAVFLPAFLRGRIKDQ